MKITYRGFALEREYGENYDALFIGDADEPLTKMVEEAIIEHGRYLSARWFVSDDEKRIEDLEADLIGFALGVGQAEYKDAYSEITGYLWTDENLVVGGHDVFGKIGNDAFPKGTNWDGLGRRGRFVHLEIEYSEVSG